MRSLLRGSNRRRNSRDSSNSSTAQQESAAAATVLAQGVAATHRSPPSSFLTQRPPEDLMRSRVIEEAEVASDGGGSSSNLSNQQQQQQPPQSPSRQDDQEQQQATTATTADTSEVATTTASASTTKTPTTPPSSATKTKGSGEATVYERDFYLSPTLLSRLILYQKYSSATRRLRDHSKEAKIWLCSKRAVSSSSSIPVGNHGRNNHTSSEYAIRQLPIHMACSSLSRVNDSILRAELEALITQLVMVYPAGCAEADHEGRIPLHEAVWNNASTSTLSALLIAAPAVVELPDRYGRSVLELNEHRHGEYKEQVKNMLQRPRQFWDRAREEASLRLKRGSLEKKNQAAAAVEPSSPKQQQQQPQPQPWVARRHETEDNDNKKKKDDDDNDDDEESVSSTGVLGEEVPDDCTIITEDSARHGRAAPDYRSSKQRQRQSSNSSVGSAATSSGSTVKPLAWSQLEQRSLQLEQILAQTHQQNYEMSAQLRALTVRNKLLEDKYQGLTANSDLVQQVVTLREEKADLKKQVAYLHRLLQRHDIHDDAVRTPSGRPLTITVDSHTATTNANTTASQSAAAGSTPPPPPPPSLPSPRSNNNKDELRALKAENQKLRLLVDDLDEKNRGYLAQIEAMREAVVTVGKDDSQADEDNDNGSSNNGSTSDHENHKNHHQANISPVPHLMGSPVHHRATASPKTPTTTTSYSGYQPPYRGSGSSFTAARSFLPSPPRLDASSSSSSPIRKATVPSSNATTTNTTTTTTTTTTRTFGSNKTSNNDTSAATNSSVPATESPSAEEQPPATESKPSDPTSSNASGVNAPSAAKEATTTTTTSSEAAAVTIARSREEEDVDGILERAQEMYGHTFSPEMVEAWKNASLGSSAFSGSKSSGGGDGESVEFCVQHDAHFRDSGTVGWTQEQVNSILETAKQMYGQELSPAWVQAMQATATSSSASTVGTSNTAAYEHHHHHHDHNEESVQMNSRVAIGVDAADHDATDDDAASPESPLNLAKDDAPHAAPQEETASTSDEVATETEAPPTEPSDASDQPSSSKPAPPPPNRPNRNTTGKSTWTPPAPLHADVPVEQPKASPASDVPVEQQKAPPSLDDDEPLTEEEASVIRPPPFRVQTSLGTVEGGGLTFSNPSRTSSQNDESDPGEVSQERKQKAVEKSVLTPFAQRVYTSMGTVEGAGLTFAQSTNGDYNDDENVSQVDDTVNELRVEITNLVRAVAPQEMGSVNQMLYTFRGRERELRDTLLAIQGGVE